MQLRDTRHRGTCRHHEQHPRLCHSPEHHHHPLTATTTTTTAASAVSHISATVPAAGSATELVCLVGGTDMLVGRSHECDWPPAVRDRPVLTGAKNPFKSCSEMNDAVVATLQTGARVCWSWGCGMRMGVRAC